MSEYLYIIELKILTILCFFNRKEKDFRDEEPNASDKVIKAKYKYHKERRQL